LFEGSVPEHVCGDPNPSHNLNWLEAKRFRAKLTNLNISKLDLVEIFIDLLEAENLKSKNLADEYPSQNVVGRSLQRLLA
jgi:hypothetical protein